MSIAPAAAAPLHIARADILPMTAPQADAMIEETKSSAVTKRTPTWLSFRHETTQCRFSFPSSLESSSVKSFGTATSPSSIKRAPPGETSSIVHCPMMAPSADLISTGCSTLRRADVLCSAPIACFPMSLRGALRGELIAGLRLGRLTHLPEAEHARRCGRGKLQIFGLRSFDIVLGTSLRLARLQDRANGRPAEIKRLARHQHGIGTATAQQPVHK